MWLASEEASFVNGAAINVDGGTDSPAYTPDRVNMLLAALGVDLVPRSNRLIFATLN
ncbi:MAG: hypothetical protein HOK67_13030 [Deltaproteobacteria bacterium]|nr:hypothetical protein [Deltaproteobacteria bacterium]MBT7712917.1 hypothetical protein [Deltaproteobacteria bacterium]